MRINIIEVSPPLCFHLGRTLAINSASVQLFCLYQFTALPKSRLKTISLIIKIYKY